MVRRPGDSLGGVASRPGGGEVYPRRSALAPGAGVDGALRVVEWGYAEVF